MERSSCSVLAFVLPAFMVALSIGPAIAETDADLSKYCRTEFPNSGPVKRVSGGVSAHYCNQRGTLQGIDYARACELTTGSREYRVDGQRVLCADGPGPARSENPLRADDFVRFCREKYPNSTYQPTPGNLTGAHSCRQVGGVVGFTLHPVNVAEACRVLEGANGYREENGLVFCESADRAETAERLAIRGAPNQDMPAPAPAPRPAERQSGDKDETTGAKTPQPADARKGGDSGIGGLWEMTVGTLPGAKIRITTSGPHLTGFLEEVPAARKAYFRQFTALEIGDVVFVGQLTGNSFSGRTPLGISGLRNVSSHPAACGAAVSEYRSDPGKWPELQATIEDGEFTGRYRGINLWFQDGACRPSPFVDHPPLVQNGWVKFELESAGECLEGPADTPPLGLADLLGERRDRTRQLASSQLAEGRP